jgi:hypothetical protein
MTAYLEPTSATHPQGGDGRVDVIVTDAGPARYVPLLLGLTGTGSARLEPALASSLAGTLLKDRYGIAGLESASTFDAPSYQMGDGGLAILPYASSSVESVGAHRPRRSGQRRSQPAQGSTCRTSPAGRKRHVRQGTSRWPGLAGLHAPVLPRLRAAISDPKLTVRERLMLGLGAGRHRRRGHGTRGRCRPGGRIRRSHGRSGTPPRRQVDRRYHPRHGAHGDAGRGERRSHWRLDCGPPVEATPGMTSRTACTRSAS